MRAAAAGLLLLCGAQPVQAQAVTLAQVYETMLAGDMDYDILRLEDEVAAELVRQARGQRLPRVTLSFGMTQTRQDIVSSDNETFSEGKSSFPTTTISLLVTQPIFDLARWRAMGVAQAEQALVSARAEVARTRLTGMMVGAFLGAARAQLGRDRAEAVMRVRSQLESQLALEVDAGRADAERLSRVQGDVFAARSDLADAELGFSDAMFELYRFSGAGPTSVSLSGNPLAVVGQAPLQAQFAKERLLDLSPDLQVARAEVAVAEKQLAQLRGTLRPTSDLVVNLGKEQTDGSLFGGGSDVQTLEIGVNVTVPIYEGGIRRSRVREAQKRVEIAQLRAAQVQEMVLRRHDALFVAVRQSAQRADAVGQQLRAAEAGLSAATDAAAAGRTGQEAVLEQRLRRDVLVLEAQAARLRVAQVQAEIYALFGALDIRALSGQFSG